ncbi:arginine--tRNA ligase [Candidatus Parcubacteria bacterium]|nr:arginine--tRNA ligase [Patescibacteria group bacterium]MBU4309433.1 arginine--tRNA ligase [Patescibacteria group bacterium]MBU4431915.1 arginine--tRNA ligase [Patescibacteria group bacterium]MBU4577794.1 arginine--tRNA ligase [Patescibacteria group bacterium]MCG2696787.1 arginine--tRNA ligase [Candidatus Parcubacteria bacterium]
MYFLEKIKKEIADKINITLGDDLVQVSDFSYPMQASYGDVSLPCFELAKKLKKSPATLASELIGQIERGKVISGISAVGPYLNFAFTKSELSKGILKEIEKQKESFGQNKEGKNKRVMIEYSNMNTHKEVHIGHLRNIFFGDSVNKILAANGYKVIPVSYINDFGIHVAKTLWWTFNPANKRASEARVEHLIEDKGDFLGTMYVESCQQAKDDKTADTLIKMTMRKIETREGEEYALWQKTREWSIEGFENLYNDLGIKFDHIFYESEYIDQGRTMVNELIKKGILKESQGAVIADLEAENNSVLVVLRSDGTATYPVADLALAYAKFEEYKLDKSIYVIDNRQSLYMKQLFSILKKMGYKQDMAHLSYDSVKLPSGPMSSRSGNIITYKELKQLLTDRTEREIRERHPAWEEEMINKTVRVIVNGAMKFEMLKIGSDQVITFDIDKAVEFSGFTGVYLQYTYARIQSILRKAGDWTAEKNDYELGEEKEIQLLLKLAKYPDIVRNAGTKNDPSELAKYLFETGQLFNDYYHSVQILKSEPEKRIARLSLISATAEVLKIGLGLLGMEVVEEM